jgi:hypothetical protein
MRFLILNLFYYWLGAELLLLEPLLMLVIFIPVIFPPLILLLALPPELDALVELLWAKTSVPTNADTANAATIATKFNLDMHFLEIFHLI